MIFTVKQDSNSGNKWYKLKWNLVGFFHTKKVWSNSLDILKVAREYHLTANGLLISGILHSGDLLKKNNYFEILIVTSKKKKTTQKNPHIPTALQCWLKFKIYFKLVSNLLSDTENTTNNWVAKIPNIFFIYQAFKKCIFKGCLQSSGTEIFLLNEKTKTVLHSVWFTEY